MEAGTLKPATREVCLAQEIPSLSEKILVNCPATTR